MCAFVHFNTTAFFKTYLFQNKQNSKFLYRLKNISKLCKGCINKIPFHATNDDIIMLFWFTIRYISGIVALGLELPVHNNGFSRTLPYHFACGCQEKFLCSFFPKLIILRHALGFPVFSLKFTARVPVTYALNNDISYG